MIWLPCCYISKDSSSVDENHLHITLMLNIKDEFVVHTPGAVRAELTSKFKSNRAAPALRHHQQYLMLTLQGGCAAIHGGEQRTVWLLNYAGAKCRCNHYLLRA
jgi:hypothetical protein